MLPEHLNKPLVSILKKPSARFSPSIGVNRSSGSDLSSIRRVDSGMGDSEYGSHVSSDVFDFDPAPSARAAAALLKRSPPRGKEETKDESYYHGDDDDGDSYTASSWLSGGVTSASGTTTGYMDDAIVEDVDEDDDDTLATSYYEKSRSGANGWFCACNVPLTDDDGDTLTHDEDGQYKNGRRSFGGMRKEKAPTAGEVLDTILEITDTTKGILKEARELVAEQGPQVIKALREKVEKVKKQQRRYSNNNKGKKKKSSTKKSSKKVAQV